MQLYDTLLGSLGVTNYHLSSTRSAARPVDRPISRRSAPGSTVNGSRLDEETRSKVGDEPAARLRQLRRQAARGPRGACRGTEASASRSVRNVSRHFASVRADLDATGVSYTLVPTLVRGLDYYSRTTWEFIGPMAQRELDDLRRGALRLPRRGDRRSADPRSRLRRRARAPADRDRGGGRRAAGGRRDRCVLRARAGRAAGRRSHAGSPSFAGQGWRQTPISPAGR